MPYIAYGTTGGRATSPMSQLAWLLMLVVVLAAVLVLGITLIDGLYRRKK